MDAERLRWPARGDSVGRGQPLGMGAMITSRVSERDDKAEEDNYGDDDDDDDGNHHDEQDD